MADSTTAAVQALSPVIETLIWALLILFLLNRFRPAIARLVNTIQSRVERGDDVSITSDGLSLKQKVENIASTVDEQQKVVEEQSRRIDQITASTENTLQSLASLVIANPMESKNYNISVKKRIEVEKTIIVGCQDYTEQRILCAIITKLLEREARQNSELGIEKVIAKYDFGGAGLNFIALSRADIDIYPAYTWQGFEMAYATSLPQKSRILIQLNPEDSITELNKVFKELSSPLKWVCHTGFQDNWEIVMEGKTAQQLGIEKISHLRRVGSDLTFGCEHDFFARPNGYSVLKNPDPAGYGISFKDVKLFDHSEAYNVLDKGEVDVIDGFSTDPQRQDETRYPKLEDDEGFFGNYYGSIVVRDDLAMSFPGLEAVLLKLAGKISKSAISEMIQEADRRSHVTEKDLHLIEVEKIAERFLDRLEE